MKRLDLYPAIAAKGCRQHDYYDAIDNTMDLADGTGTSSAPGLRKTTAVWTFNETAVTVSPSYGAQGRN